MTTIWTEPIVLRLKELCLDSTLSNALIADVLQREFSVTVTRNAVIGKRARDGISSPNVKPPKTARRKSPERSRPKFQFASLPRLRVTKAAIATLPLPTVFPHACGLLDLSDGTCRFPCGDVGADDFFFCGSPGASLAEGRPYCPAHTQIVRSRT